MTELKIVAAPGMFGGSVTDHPIEAAMRLIGVAFGEEGDWCAKYGTNYENDVFAMRRFYWGDCTCSDDTLGHGEHCGFSKPNFLFKPTGFRLEWYKYIGRDMEAKGGLPADWLQQTFASHPTGMTLEQGIAELAKQTDATASAFAAMFASLGTSKQA
jgi:hypothetical protein